MSAVAEWDGHGHGDDVDEADEVLEEPETFYGSADEFVREFLIVTYRREVSPKGDFRWDPRWWMHPEAVARLDALWRTWEHFRGDGATGMSVWWRDHADHHMSVLLSLRGTVRQDVRNHGARRPAALHSTAARIVHRRPQHRRLNTSG